jgi:short-subunit dehydrogenase
LIIREECGWKRLDLAAQLEKEHGVTAHVVAADFAKPEAPEIIKTLTDRGIARRW